MTADERRCRRQIKHSLMKQIERYHFSTDTKLQMTPGQLRAAIRKVADQLMSGVNPNSVVGF